MARIGVTVISIPCTEDGFDPAALHSFCHRHEVTAWRDHFFVCDGRPQLAVLLEHVIRERVASSGARGPVAQAHADEHREKDPRKDLTPEDLQVFERLREWRALRASRDGVPVYVIFKNRQLAEIARQRPSSKSALREIEGVGEAKVAKYGEDVLTVMASLPQQQGGGDANHGS